MAKCTGCGRAVQKKEGVVCSSCASHLHRACVNIPQEVRVSSSWLCPSCKAQTPRKYNTDIAITGASSDIEPSPTPGSDGRSPAVLATGACGGLEEQMKLFRDEITAMRSEMTCLRQEVSKFSSYLETMGKRIHDVEERVTSLENRISVSESSPHQNSMLLDTIAELRQVVSDRDQELLANDIEITGLPETKGENVTHIMTLMAKKLGVNLVSNDIVYAERRGARRAVSGGGSGEGGTMGVGADMRPRPVVLRLARRVLRDDLLQAARVRRGADTEGMDLDGPAKRFYINERLTRQNRDLFFRVREECKRRSWRFAWTKGGRIYARADTGKTAFRIRSQQDFLSVFGDRPV